MVVADLISAASQLNMPLTLISGESGLNRNISSPRIQRPGVALAGYLDNLHPDRLLVIGRAEVDYLFSLTDESQKLAIGQVLGIGVPAVIVATQEEIEFPQAWKDVADEFHIPFFHSPGKSRNVIQILTDFLEDRLSERFHLHGVLLEILEVGVLVLGRSGIGKSESALDLVNRGHRLVADDLIEIRHSPRGVLVGRSVDPIKYHMEIRGLGIINIQDLFGVSAIREEKELDLVIELVDWDPDGDYERLGLDELVWESLGVEIPSVKIPVSPGRNVSTIIEVAARNQLLKKMGHHSAQRLDQTIQDRLQKRLDAREENPPDES